MVYHIAFGLTRSGTVIQFGSLELIEMSGNEMDVSDDETYLLGPSPNDSFSGKTLILEIISYLLNIRVF